MSKRIWRIALIVLAAAAQPTIAADRKSSDAPAPTSALPGDLLAGLVKGGYVIYIRHAATDHAASDTDRKNLRNCATQRNLSTLGRRQAARIGAAFRKLRIPVGRIVSSPYCRCLDTARLAFGRVEPSRDLVSAPDPRGPEAKRLATSLYRMLGTPPKAGTNTVIVGHSSNIYDATNIQAKPEGVAVIFRPSGGGRVFYVRKVHPGAWQKTARAR